MGGAGSGGGRCLIPIVLSLDVLPTHLISHTFPGRKEGRGRERRRERCRFQTDGLSSYLPLSHFLLLSRGENPLNDTNSGGNTQSAVGSLLFLVRLMS